MRKKVIVAIVICLAVACVIGAAYFITSNLSPSEPLPVGLQVEEDGTYYYGENGERLTGWQVIDGNRYYFDLYTGKAVEGWYTDAEGNTYYFGDAGYALTGQQEIDGKSYEFDAEGRLITDIESEQYIWQVKDGETYCVDSAGNYVKGLCEINGALYYFDEDTGARQSGWQEIDGKRYYFSKIDGRAAKGWYTDTDGKTYYFGDEGYALTGQQTISGKNYTFNENGSLQVSTSSGGSAQNTTASSSSQNQGTTPNTNNNNNANQTSSSATVSSSSTAVAAYTWVEEGGKVYCKDASGNLLKGLQNIDGAIYYFDESTGARLTGWQTINAKKFHFNETDGKATLGWLTDSGNYYYFGTGGYALTGVQLIDNAHYYFDENGARQAGWQNVSDNLYFFDTTSGKAVKGWYTTDAPHTTATATARMSQSATYYFGADGFALKGIVKVDNQYYYLNENYMRQTGWQIVGGHWYCFDDETGAAKSGWAELPDGSGRCYLSDDGGYVLVGLQILENETYYFDATGAMQTGWRSVEQVWYCFDSESGKAIKNRFAEDKGGDVRYLGDDGAALTSLHTINGEIYFFDLEGVRQTGWIFAEGNYYFFDITTGAAQKNEWLQIDNNWHYLLSSGKAGKGLQQIDDNWYYFNNDTICQSGWQTVDGKQHYFADDGKAFTGWKTIGESRYYFAANGAVTAGLVQISNSYYYFSATGEMQTGWQKVGSLWYCFADDGAARTGWYSEGNDQYYLHDTDAYALTGEHKIGDVTYLFDETGLLIDKTYEAYTWRQENGKTYFAGPDGKFVTGLQTIKDEAGIAQLYYFEEETGAMQTGEMTLNEKYYIFKENGAACKGWHTDTVSGNTYYFDDKAGYALVGRQLIDGSYYYFDENGVRYSGWLDLGDEKAYFGTDGKTPNGFFTDADGKTYLFGEQGFALKGLQTYADNVYFLDENGVRVSGWKEIDGRRYCFDGENNAAYKGWHDTENGRYYFGSGSYALNGLQTIEGKKYYFVENILQYGLKTIESRRYYFGEDGAAIQGWHTVEDSGSQYYFGPDFYAVVGYYTIDEAEYYFNQDGILEYKVEPHRDTWIIEGENTYYLDESGTKVTGLQTIDGYRYYFNEDGVMQTGWVDHNGERYYFANDGKGMGGWQSINGATYYFGQAGFALTGEQEIDGRVYHFDTEGRLTQDEVPTQYEWLQEGDIFYYVDAEGNKVTGLLSIEGDLYYFDESGARQSGFFVIDGARYYFGEEDGKAYRGWQEIDGRWYRFDSSSSKQLLNWQYRSFGEGETATYYYYPADDGDILMGNSPLGWVMLNEIERYFFADGHMALGWTTIEEKTYYFLVSGQKATGTHTIDGVSYHFDENGQLTEGWQTDADGNRYYYTSEGASKGWCLIASRWYLFDSDTAMQQIGWQYRPLDAGGTNAFYYSDDGTLPPAGFSDVNGVYRYIYADGHVAQGWQEIEGARYYFTNNGEMLRGVQTIEGVEYYFAQDGKLQTGWQTDADGNRYYFSDKGTLKGWQQVENRWYYFKTDTGVQQLGWQYRTSGGTTLHYYYFEDGSLPDAGWTSEVDGTRRYVASEGNFAQGWLKLSEGRYYFNKGQAATGWVTIASRWYTFDASGIQGVGWQKKAITGGTAYYYYNEDGTLPAAGWLVMSDARRYVLADGQMARAWQTLDGYTYYFNDDGTYLTGRHTISGSICIFDSSGHYIAAPVISAVNVDNATGKVMVSAVANASLTDKTITYSFDGGVTWQSANNKTFASGTTIAAGRIQIRDSVGNVTTYKAAITIKTTFTTGKGIDVSAHQGLINWAQVKASGVEYAIIRSLCWDKTKNYYTIDPYFDYNVRNAKANGIKVGTYLYSYAYSKAEMAEEVLYFLNSTEIKKLMAEGIYFDLPVFIDYEDPLITKNTANLTISQRTDIVRYGMQILEQRSNYKFLPGFYTYYNFAKTAINGAELQREGFEFWLARYDAAAHGWSPAPDIWQYSSKGSVPGINTNVDLNYIYVDYSTIINGGSTPPPITSHNLTVTNQYGSVITAPASTILAQIVEAEVGGFGNAEVYKAQAVAAQSWILYNQGQGVTAPRVNLKTASSAVQTAVNAVLKETLYYGSSQAFTPYYAYSNGTTNNGAYWGNNLPYLSSVSSSWDAAKSATVGYVSAGDLKARIEAVYGAGFTNGVAMSDWIKVTGRNAAGYVTSVSVCGKRTPTVDYFYQTLIRYTGGNGSYVYPIASPSFSISFNGSNSWTFTSTGYGHGVGMSQYGAYCLATQGKTYKDILAYYYPGTKIVTV